MSFLNPAVGSHVPYAMNSVPTTIALCLASLCLLPQAARADDEGSEHTAQLYGQTSDTVGVSLKFNTDTGWEMSLRPKPSAEARTISLGFLPSDHAHYAVVVGPDRDWLAFITQSRTDIGAKTGAIWTMNSQGKVLDRWTFGDIIKPDEQAQLTKSAGHTQWLEAAPQVKGEHIELRLKSHRLLVAPRRAELKRISARP